jgi:ornithine cyclodeaminase/alanine dehydrogenase-like protein (mu-crystallin family)
VGVKLVTLTPANSETGRPFIHAVYVLFDAETQAPAATFDGAALNPRRTPAGSGQASRWVARPEARRLVL